MRKLLFLFLLLSANSFGQMISGDLLAEGRKLVTPCDFRFDGRTNGYARFELSVDREGNVTGARLLETDIKSTPAMYELRKEITKLKFEKGTYYPQFHHVVVNYTMTKKA